MNVLTPLAAGLAVSAVAMSAHALPVLLNFEVPEIQNLSTTPYANQGVTFSNLVGIESIPAPHVNAIISGDLHDGSKAIRSVFPTPGIPGTTVTFESGQGFTSVFSFIYSSNQTLLFGVNYIDAFNAAQTFNAELSATFAPNIGPAQTDLDFDPPLAGCGQAGSLQTGDPIFCKWAEVTATSLGLPLTGSLTSLTFAHSLSADTPPGAALDKFQFNNNHAALPPVPEPSTYALMALGLLGIGVATRRRMHRT